MHKYKIFIISALLLVFLQNLPAWGSEIHKAADRGDIKTVMKILDKNPELVNLKDKYGEIPLHGAVRNLHHQTARYLISRKSQLNVESIYGYTPLLVACQSDLQMVILLVSKGAHVNRANKEGIRPLFYITDIKMGSYLISHGANPAVQDAEGVSPLHIAADNGNGDLIRLYVKNGANINCADNRGYTPLHVAAADGVEPSVKALLQLGADPCLTDRQGKTPLHVACDGVERMNRYIPKALIKAGAPVNLKDAAGKTAMDYAKLHFDSEYRKYLTELLKEN